MKSRTRSPSAARRIRHPEDFGASISIGSIEHEAEMRSLRGPMSCTRAIKDEGREERENITSPERVGLKIPQWLSVRPYMALLAPRRTRISSTQSTRRNNARYFTWLSKGEHCARTTEKGAEPRGPPVPPQSTSSGVAKHPEPTRCRPSPHGNRRRTPSQTYIPPTSGARAQPGGGTFAMDDCDGDS